MKIKFITILVWLMFCQLFFAQTGAYQKETKATKATRMQWYQDARFGMFIHWGAYSQLDGEYKGKKQKDPKGEWIMRNLKIPVDEYATEIAGKFNPKHFDADKWAKTAKEAGMKYLVITTKHHDGFALFDSDVSDYNIVDASPFKRDVIKELSDACRRYGLKFGVYYSQAQDWHHPGGLAPKNRWDKKQNGDWVTYFKTIVKGQVTELLSNYGEVSLLWWDSGRATQNKKVADSIAKELVKLQPTIIVNPRLGGNLKGDFNTYEQVIPGVFTKEYNELCLTHNRSWSYKPSDDAWKSPEFLLKTLVHITALGGNFLFNVGPNQDGEFPEQTLKALQYIGDWMKVNGASIYGTQANPFYKLPFGEATLKTNGQKTNLYLHIYNWPKKQKLSVPGLKNNIVSATLLGTNTILKTKKKTNSVEITGLPKEKSHPAVSVLVLEIEEPLHIDAGFIKPSASEELLLTPSNALLTIKPQFDCIPTIIKTNNNTYFDNWKNCIPHPRFKNTGNKAHWKVEIPSKGNYKVIATVATQNNRNVVTFQAKDKVKITLPNTGGMDVFKRVELGEVSLKKGINTLTFAGGKKMETWDFVRLKEIQLLKIQ